MDESTATRLSRTIETDRGPVAVEVNRRGCTKPWTPACDEALQALVRAAVASVDR